MNTLSWLIYAADSLVSLKTIVGALSVISLIGTGLVLIGALISIGESYDDEDARKFSRLSFRLLKIGFPVVLASSILWSAIPSAKTIYMIAASEAGAQIVTSPDAIEMMADLKAIIKKRLKEELESN